MKIVKKKIEIKKLNEMTANSFGNFVKAVVDIKNECMADGLTFRFQNKWLISEVKFWLTILSLIMSINPAINYGKIIFSPSII